MAKRDETPIEATPGQIEEVIERVRHSSLPQQDRTLIERLLRLVLVLTELLQRKNATISSLKRMLFGPSTDRRVAPEQADAEAGPTTGEPATPKTKTRRRGHGRQAASAFAGAERVPVKHPTLRVGDACPSRCGGRVFLLSEPAILIRLDGRAPIAARRFERERFRCSSCQDVFVAPLPQGVDATRYDASADATLAVMRYAMGMPAHRLAQLQRQVGVPVAESVQFERCEQLADAVHPVYEQLKREAAASAVLHADDTPVRILRLRAQIEAERAAAAPKRVRTGIQTTAIVATPLIPERGPRVALDASGRQHAGENTAALLSKRSAQTASVIRMGDGASANRVGEVCAVEVWCWSHARRKFIELQTSFPEQTRPVLDQIEQLYRVEAETKQMTPAQRLSRHQAESGPALDALRAWIEQQVAEGRVEPTSRLMKAFSYLLDAWPQFTEFLRTPGVPLDDNIAERQLKVTARARKNSLFTKTEPGAWISDVLTSVIATCTLNGVNPIEYLTAVGRHRAQVRASPEAWLPWNDWARARAGESVPSSRAG